MKAIKNIQKLNEKKILAIDTSSATASVALIEFYSQLVCLPDTEGSYIQSIKILAECSIKQSAKTYSETLMPMVDHIFKLTSLTMQNIDYIACTNGPGSFTGLRIGAATAKGLAFAIGKPLIAVPTLDAMAYTVTNMANMPNMWVIPMMDARREQAYSAFYNTRAGRITDYMAAPIEELLGMLSTLIIKDKEEGLPHVTFITDGGENFAFDFYQLMTLSSNWSLDIAASTHITHGFHGRPLAGCVGMLAVSQIGFANGVQPEDKFELMYIRKPQAEREREERGEKT